MILLWEFVLSQEFNEVATVQIISVHDRTEEVCLRTGKRWVPVLLFYFQAQLSRCFIPAEQVDCLSLPLTPWGPAAATASCTQLAHPLPAELGNHA